MTRVGEVWNVVWEGFGSPRILLVVEDKDDTLVALDLMTGSVHTYMSAFVRHYQESDSWLSPTFQRLA